MRRGMIIRLLGGLALLAALLTQVRPHGLATAMAKASPWWLALSLVPAAVVFMISTLNYDVLLRAVGIKIKWRRLLKATLMSSALGFLAPGKAGDVSLVYFLSDLLRVGPGLGVLLLDKLVTLLVTSVIGLVGLLALGKGWAAAAFAGVGLVGAAAGVILLVADDLRGRLGRLLMGRHREKLEGFASTVKAVLSQPSALIRNAGLTLARYGCGVSAMWMTFVAIGESVPVWVIALVTAIVTLVSVVPVSISGLGVREVSGTVMYVILAGLSAESAAAAMLIGSFRMYLATGIAFVTGNAMSVTEEA